MSFALKSFLLIIALISLVASVEAQQRRKPPASGKAAANKNTRSDEAEESAEDAQEKAAALFEEGQNAHEAGKLEDAVRLYSNALKLDASLWQAEYQRGNAYVSLNRLSEAAASFREVLKQLAELPESPEKNSVEVKVQIALGESLLTENKFSEAEPVFKRALELQPDAGRAHLGLAQIFLAGNKPGEAAISARAAIKAGDERASTFALLGASLVSSRNYDEALTALNEALKREPQNAAALRYRAEAFSARKNFPPAIADLQASLKLEKNASVLMRLAELHAQDGNTAEAEKAARQALELDPANAAAKNLLAASTIETGDAAQAITQLEAMLKAEPGRADVRAKLAEKYLPAQPDKAFEQYTEAARLEPNNLRHQIGAGSALVKLKRFAEAADTMRRVLAQNPPTELAYFAHTNLATALFEQDDYANAAREFLWILQNQREQKKTAVTLFLLGICFDKLGDFEQALKAYEQFLAIAPPENQLEIDKVKLRLDPLKRQIEKSGRKKKK